MDLAGVVVGALLGFVSAYVLARYQAGREDRYRFVTLRQEKYAEFVRLARDHVRTVNMQMAARVESPGRRPADVPTLGDSEPIDSLSAEIAILARERVWQASRDLYDEIVKLDAFAFDDAKPPKYLHGDVAVSDYPMRLAGFNQVLERFLIEAKTDLGTLAK